MNSIFSLRLKLIIYTLLFVIFAVLSVGYITNKSIENHFYMDVQSKFRESFRILSTELKNTGKQIYNTADLISNNENIIASMSLIKNYEDINNYNSILFDEEKKRVVNILTLKGKYSQSNSLSIYDSYGKLVAFVKKVKGRYLTFYVSYKDSKRVFYSKEINELSYKREELSREIKTELNNLNSSTLVNKRDEGIVYEVDKKILKLEVKRAISRNLSNGTKELLGYTKSIKYFSPKDISDSLNPQMLASYSMYDKKESDSLLLNSPILFSQFSSSELQVHNKGDFFFTSALIPLKKGALLLKLSTNKKEFEETLSKNKKDLIILMFMIMLIAITISLLILNKMISTPLKELLNGINTLSMGDYKHKMYIKSNDELGLISTQFNNMAEEISKREEELDNLAHYDSLTKTPNRTMFMETLNKAISRAKRLDNKLAVLFLDLDDFKSINDSLGHNVGDELLIQFSKNLSHALRENDMLSRIGGDEFNILIEDLSSVHNLIRIAEKLMRQMQIPINIENNQIIVTGSLGISIYPDDAQNSTALLKNADLAMYSAKDNGRNQYKFFSKELELSLNSRIQ
ncbi:MAG: GGDEF domain-containing protein, partial [Campylobacterota bacterium]